MAGRSGTKTPRIVSPGITRAIRGLGVDISLYKNDSFDSFIYLQPIGIGGSNSYNWYLPSSLVPGSDYTIRIFQRIPEHQ